MSVWTMNIKFSSKTSESFSNCRCLGLCKNYYLEDNTSLQSRPAAGLNINEIFMSEIYLVREGRVSINYSVDDGQVEERVTISQRKQYPQTEDRGKRAHLLTLLLRDRGGEMFTFWRGSSDRGE